MRQTAVPAWGYCCWMLSGYLAAAWCRCCDQRPVHCQRTQHLQQGSMLLRLEGRGLPPGRTAGTQRKGAGLQASAEGDHAPSASRPAPFALGQASRSRCAKHRLLKPSTPLSLKFSPLLPFWSCQHLLGSRSAPAAVTSSITTLAPKASTQRVAQVQGTVLLGASRVPLQQSPGPAAHSRTHAT